MDEALESVLHGDMLTCFPASPAQSRAAARREAGLAEDAEGEGEELPASDGAGEEEEGEPWEDEVTNLLLGLVSISHKRYMQATIFPGWVLRAGWIVLSCFGGGGRMGRRERDRDQHAAGPGEQHQPQAPHAGHHLPRVGARDLCHCV